MHSPIEKAQPTHGPTSSPPAMHGTRVRGAARGRCGFALKQLLLLPLTSTNHGGC